MLKKSAWPLQKDQQHAVQTTDPGSCILEQNQQNRSFSFLSVPGLFVAMSPKVSPDAESVKSPTSPLDFRALRSPRSPGGRGWDCRKVGLGIVDSLDDDVKLFGKSQAKTILFGPRLRAKDAKCQMDNSPFQGPKSLPNNYAAFPHARIKSTLRGDCDILFEIGEIPSEMETSEKSVACSLDSSLFNFTPGKRRDTRDSASPGQRFLQTTLSSVPFPLCSDGPDDELSEEYTCVISRGPNPKTIHIFGDCILECHPNDSGNLIKKEPLPLPLPESTSFPSSNFLSFCYSCSKKLEEGQDIYIYRGESAFCSLDCRSEVISIDMESEKSIDEPPENFVMLESASELFEGGIVFSA